MKEQIASQQAMALRVPPECRPEVADAHEACGRICRNRRKNLSSVTDGQATSLARLGPQQ